jgi:hypothetical protein
MECSDTDRTGEWAGGAEGQAEVAGRAHADATSSISSVAAGIRRGREGLGGGDRALV